MRPITIAASIAYANEPLPQKVEGVRCNKPMFLVQVPMEAMLIRSKDLSCHNSAGKGWKSP